MEIIILAIKGVLYAILAATIVFGGAVLVAGIWAYYKCQQDEEERQADNDE